MELCDCIKNIDLDDYVKIEQLRMYPCLAVAISSCKINPEDDDIYYTDKDKLITILFKAVQELKTEIDTLKN